MKEYIKEKKLLFLFVMGVLAFVNLYFGVICGTNVYTADLLYMDMLYILAAGLYIGRDYKIWKQIGKISKQKQLTEEKELKKLLGNQTYSLWEKEQQQLEKEISDLHEEVQELTDYMTKWVHETKLPLASLKLMNERNQDEKLKEEMQDCIERLGQLLNRMVMNGKLCSPQYDIKFERTTLWEAVRESMKNQSYFLIKEHFHIETELENMIVYSDRRWLVYLLDQLIGNSIKYRKEEPKLFFGAKKLSEEEILFWMEDNGIGIEESDISYIFDKGYVGSNLRNGDYRSTGMGLYFAGKIAKHLGIEMRVQSKPGEGTRFELLFRGNTDYLILD